MVMNMDTWNGFPKDIQDALNGIGEQISIQYGVGAFDKSRKDMADVVKKAGFPMNEYTVAGRWVTEMERCCW